VPVARIDFESNAGQVAAALNTAAGAVDKLGTSADTTQQKVHNIGKRAQETMGFFEKLTSSMGGNAAAAIGLGAGFGVATVAAEKLMGMLRALPAEFGRVLDKAGKLSDLSAQLDIGTESLQRLEYMGKQTGVSLETLSNAALQVQRRIQDQPQLFEKWGVSVRALRDLKPEEQLAAISDVIRGLPDRQQQVAAAYDLMGRTGTAALALLREDMSGLLAESDELSVALGSDLVKAADDVGDASVRLSSAWEGLKDNLVASMIAASGADSVLDDLARGVAAVNRNAQDNGGLRIWVALVERLTGLKGLRDAAALLSLANTGAPGLKGGTRASIGTALATPAGIDAEAARIMRDALEITEAQVRAHDKAGAAAKRHAESVRENIANAYKEAWKDFNDFEARRSRGGMVLFGTDDQAPGFGEMPAGMAAAVARQEELNKLFWKSLAKSPEAQAAAAEAAQRLRESVASEFAGLANEIGGLIGGAFGTMLGRMGDLLSRWIAANKGGLGSFFSGATGQRIMGGLGIGVGAFAAGKESKSALGGALGGAATGALAGSFIPGIGTTIGAGIGFIAGGLGGLLGGRSASREREREKAEEMAALRQEFDALMASADQAGILFDRLFDTSSAEGLRSAIDEITAKLERQKEVYDGLARATTGANTMLESFPVLSAETAGAQGAIFASVFWANAKEHGIVAAAEASHEAWAAFQESIAASGIELPPEVLNIFEPITAAMRLASDETLAPMVQGLAGATEAVRGLGDAGYMTAGAFEGLGTLSRATFDEIVAKTGDSNLAFQAIAPSLAQIKAESERYGLTIDANTQALIDQAEAAGISFPTDPMLQVVGLLEQMVVLMGGTLPEAMGSIPGAAEEAFGATGAAAAEAAGGIEGEMAAMAGAVSDSLSSLPPEVEGAMALLEGASTATLDEMAGNFDTTFVDVAAAATTEVQRIIDKINLIPTNRDVHVNATYTGRLNDDGSPDLDGNPTNSYAMGGEAFFPYRRGGHLIRVGDAPGGEFGTFTPAGKMGGGGAVGELRAIREAVDTLGRRIDASDARYEQSNRALILGLPAMFKGAAALAKA
jgi:hypothetical protein